MPLRTAILLAAVLEAPILPVKAIVVAVAAVGPVEPVAVAVVAIVAVALMLAVALMIVAVLLMLRPLVVEPLLRLIERSRRLHLRLWRATLDGALTGLGVRAKLVAVVVSELIPAIHRILRTNHGAGWPAHAAGERIGATLTHLLLAEGHNDAVVMLGMLHVVFSQNRVAGRVRVARQLHIFFRNMRGRATKLHIRPGALKTTSHRVLRFPVIAAVVGIIVPAAAAAILLSLPHGLPFKVCLTCLLGPLDIAMTSGSLSRLRPNLSIFLSGRCQRRQIPFAIHGARVASMRPKRTRSPLL